MSDYLLRLLGNSFIAFMAVQFVKDVAYPWFKEFRREPAKLKSTYVGTINPEGVGSHKISVHLRRSGYKVSGLLLFEEGNHNGKEYKLTGRYSHGLLTFTYWPKDSAGTSEGSGTFQRLPNGDLFSGYLAYSGQSASQVRTIHCDLDAAPPKPHYSEMHGSR